MEANEAMAANKKERLTWVGKTTVLLSAVIVLYVWYSLVGLTMYRSFGTYQIESMDVENGVHYLHIVDGSNRKVRLNCTEEAYNLVEHSREDYFKIEYSFNCLFPDRGRINKIERDEYLNERINIKGHPGRIFLPGPIQRITVFLVGSSVIDAPAKRWNF